MSSSSEGHAPQTVRLLLRETFALDKHAVEQQLFGPVKFKSNLILFIGMFHHFFPGRMKTTDGQHPTILQSDGKRFPGRAIRLSFNAKGQVVHRIAPKQIHLRTIVQRRVRNVQDTVVAGQVRSTGPVPRLTTGFARIRIVPDYHTGRNEKQSDKDRSNHLFVSTLSIPVCFYRSIFARRLKRITLEMEAFVNPMHPSLIGSIAFHRILFREKMCVNGAAIE